MRKSLFWLSASLGLFGSANAATLLIDDFSRSQAAVQGPPAAVGPALTGTGFWSNRVLSILSASGSPDLGAYIEITNGQLQIANGPNVSAVSAITWQLDLTALSAALSSATFIEVSIDQVAVDFSTVQVSPGGLARTTAHNSLAVMLFQGASIATITNPFIVTFDSALNVDSKWDNLKITYTCRRGATGLTTQDSNNDQCQVPLPGGAPLLALGLVGLVCLGRDRQS
jgi:hypothetical protein